MTLGEKRCVFTANIAKLLTWATDNGYTVALDEVRRSQEQANANAVSGAGIANSLHVRGLAADLLLYIDGVYQATGDKYRPLGEYWKTLDPLNAYGGDFSKPDPDHFSMSDGGIK